MFRRTSAFLLLLFINTGAFAAPIQPLTLPGQLQTCVDAGDCFINSAATVSIGQMSAYYYEDYRQGGVINGYALRYSLLPPSSETSPSGQAPYAGDIWLTLRNTYDLTLDSSLITVYTDLVSPQPTNLLVDSTGLDIDINMSNSALLSGSGYETIGISNGIEISTSNMQLLSDQGGGAIPACLSLDCEAGARLNLIYLDFVQNGSTASLQFNANDNRSLLYQVYDTASLYTSESFYVAPVPLPPALVLFSSGILVFLYRASPLRTYIKST